MAPLSPGGARGAGGEWVVRKLVIQEVRLPRKFGFNKNMRNKKCY
jgi:hypothetical protein